MNPMGTELIQFVTEATGHFKGRMGRMKEWERRYSVDQKKWKITEKWEWEVGPSETHQLC